MTAQLNDSTNTAGAPPGWQQTTVHARAEVAVWHAGSGPAVLLVHGFPDHPCGLLDFAGTIVDAGYRCILPALPGYWPSAKVPDNDYSVSAVGDDLLKILDVMEVPRAAYIGHDWGAEIGYPLIAANPARFSTFVALGTPHPRGYIIRRSVFAEMRTAWYAIFLAYAPNAYQIAGNRAWLTTLMQSWSPGMQWDKWPAVLDALLRPGVLETVCRYYRANMDSMLPAPELSTPTTIIHGGQDGCISPNNYPADLDRWFTAGLERVFLPNVGHWPHLEDTEATLRVVLDQLGIAR